MIVSKVSFLITKWINTFSGTLEKIPKSWAYFCTVGHSLEALSISHYAVCFPISLWSTVPSLFKGRAADHREMCYFSLVFSATATKYSQEGKARTKCALHFTITFLFNFEHLFECIFSWNESQLEPLCTRKLSSFTSTYCVFTPMRDCLHFQQEVYRSRVSCLVTRKDLF